MNRSTPAFKGKKKNASFRAWLVALIVAAAAAGGAAGWYFLLGPGRAGPTAAQNASPGYHTSTVRRGNISISTSGSGTLVAQTSADLKFSARGPLTLLNVALGDKVTAGQLLARVGSSESLQAAAASARLQLLQNQKTLADLEQNALVAVAQANQAYLKAQDAYASALRADQRTAYARCSQDTNTRLAATLDNAAKTLSDLSISDSGSDAWIEAKARYDTALANYTNCIAYTDAEKASTAAALEVAKEALAAAERTYTTLKANGGVDPTARALAEANIQQAETQLALAQTNLAGLRLTAPIDGTVTFLAAQVGAVADTNKFITISSRSRPTVSISVDQNDLAMLALDARAEVVFDALPDLAFSGKVVQLDPQLTTSGQYQVAKGQVELDTASADAVQALPLGVNATVTIIRAEAKNTLVVPLAALRDLGDKSYAVFRLQNGKLLLTPVKVGLLDSVQAEILGGLKEGEEISTGIVQGMGN